MNKSWVSFILPVFVLFVLTVPVSADSDPLPSWNDGQAKRAIISFVKETTNEAGSGFVAPNNRVATFDQDGTLWVEHPVYTQVIYCLDRVREILKTRPELANTEPFRTVASGKREAIAHLSMEDLEKIFNVALSGMNVDEFAEQVKKWISDSRHIRWNRPYTQLVYQPMIEVIQYLKSNGYKTYIVTGSAQDFVREYSEQVYGIPPEQVIGTVQATKYGYDKSGKPTLIKEPKVLLQDDYAGKPEGIHLAIGQRPRASFGNSTGDRQMLEYSKAGTGKRLCMLVLHDDAAREYSYGPAQGLPGTRIGAFSQELYDEAVKNDWIVISMKNDWKRVFPFEP